MIAKLRYLGRALALFPSELGEFYEEVCTVSRHSVDTEWVEDVATGSTYPVRTRNISKIPLFWYTEEGDTAAFCALAGYGPRILADLNKYGYQVTVEDFVDDGLGKPDLSQIEGVSWRSRQKEVFSKLLAHRGGIVVCPTGWGKTFLVKLLAKVYPRAEILITVNSNDIASNIYDDLKYDLGSQLGRIGAGKSYTRRVTVCTSQSLHKAPKDVNLILADECHTLMTENYVKKFNKFRRARIFGFTATPEGRSDKAEGFGEAVFGQQIADVTYQEGVAGGNIVQLQVRMITSSAGPDVAGMRNTADADRLGLWLNDYRNRLIAYTVRKVEEEIGDDQQLLVMVDKTEHAYALGQLLPEFPIVTGEPSPARITAMRKRGAMTPEQEPCTKKMREAYRKAFETHELKRAIATKIWSKGVDFRDLAVLVRADGTGSPLDSGQVPGRLSRLGDKTSKLQGLLIDFMDKFSKNLQYRSVQRLRVYRKNGFQVEVR